MLIPYAFNVFFLYRNGVSNWKSCLIIVYEKVFIMFIIHIDLYVFPFNIILAYIYIISFTVARLILTTLSRQFFRHASIYIIRI